MSANSWSLIVVLLVAAVIPANMAIWFNRSGLGQDWRSFWRKFLIGLCVLALYLLSGLLAMVVWLNWAVPNCRANLAGEVDDCHLALPIYIGLFVIVGGAALVVYVVEALGIHAARRAGRRS